MTSDDLIKGYDSQLMASDDAKYFVNHLKDCHSAVNQYLKSSNTAFS